MSEFYDKLLRLQSAGKQYIIAELGSNWKTVEDLLGSVNFAKNCGADAIKFQYFTKSELFGPKAEIDKTFPLSQLKEKADAAGIDFLCSAFSAEGVRQVDKFVPAHKVASSEMSHIRILEAVKKTGKPLLLSTGGYFLPDIKRVVDFMRDGAPDYPIILNHCNLAYPATMVDLKKFAKLKDYWTGILGYSDHTTIVCAVPVFMAEQGVTVYEKHFNPFEYADTPDAGHSLNRKKFKTMVSYLRKDPLDETEEDMARLMNIRRVIAIKDVMPGDRFVENENMGIFRSQKPDARGVGPFGILKLEGQIATKPVKAGDGISIQDIQ